MGFKIQAGLILALGLAALACSPSARAAAEQKDSLVRLVKAASVQLIEKDGRPFRKATDATFLHNGTYLISDTALWDVNTKFIKALGHVRIIQDETVLTSDRLDYDIDGNLAMFRGTLVQLQDRQRNTLRTLYLDYNTRDSVAVFSKGGSLKDKDGQIIESLDGEYASQKKVFKFRGEVNMFTDSVFIKTNTLEYRTEFSKAIFPAYVDFWKDKNMLSAGSGWYDRPSETFFFTDSVHALTEHQESWSDTLFYYRTIDDVKLFGNAQIQDTTRNVSALADYIHYCDSLSQVILQHRAAVAMKTEDENHRVDTLYVGADSLVYWTRYKCEISEEEMKTAEERKSEMFVDPVQEYRLKAAKEAAEAAAEAAKENPNDPGAAAAKRNAAGANLSSPHGQAPGRTFTGSKKSPGFPAAATDSSATVHDSTAVSPDSMAASMDSLAVAPDSLGVAPDSLAVAPDSLAACSDSLSVASDSLAVAPDSSRVGFLLARGRVKAYRHDIQMKADSLRYSDLDSIARFYIDPVVWNEGNRQYSSDSLFMLVRGNGLDRASLMSNAFIITQEDSLCFDQIKGTEVMAYFDTTSALRRFDALGGATALFYLTENDALATVNKVESKMLSGIFSNGTIDQVYYFDSPKNDAYPVVQMNNEDKRMKGFNWQPELRPESKADITTLELKPSERTAFESRPRSTFVQTDRFFPGYMKGVYRRIEIRDSLSRLPKPVAKSEIAGAVPAEADSLAAAVDSLAVTSVADSLKMASDSLKTAPDSLKTASDSLSTGAKVAEELTPSQIKAAERAARKAARDAAREERWKELDARDAAKAEARKQKALERKRSRTRKLLEAKMKQDAIDAAKLEKYKQRYYKKKNKSDDGSNS